MSSSSSPSPSPSPSPSSPSSSTVSSNTDEIKKEMKEVKGDIEKERAHEEKLKHELTVIETAIEAEKKKEKDDRDEDFIAEKKNERNVIRSQLEDIRKTLSALQGIYHRLLSSLASPSPSLSPCREQDIPVYLCSMENYDKHIVSENCELLIDTGNLLCDLFLPAHDALKMGCTPTPIKRVASPINSTPIVIIQMRPQLLVRFVLSDDKNIIQERMALLEVFVGEGDLKEQMDKHDQVISPSSSAPLPDSTSPSTPPKSASPPASTQTINHVSPIKYHKGTSRGKALIGWSGRRKLNITWQKETNHICVLDEEIYDI